MEKKDFKKAKDAVKELKAQAAMLRLGRKLMRYGFIALIIKEIIFLFYYHWNKGSQSITEDVFDIIITVVILFGFIQVMSSIMYISRVIIHTLAESIAEDVDGAIKLYRDSQNSKAGDYINKIDNIEEELSNEEQK